MFVAQKESMYSSELYIVFWSIGARVDKEELNINAFWRFEVTSSSHKQLIACSQPFNTSVGMASSYSRTCAHSSTPHNVIDMHGNLLRTTHN